MFLNVCYILYLCRDMCTWCSCGGQGVTWKNLSSPTTCVPGLISGHELLQQQAPWPTEPSQHLQRKAGFLLLLHLLLLLLPSRFLWTPWQPSSSSQLLKEVGYEKTLTVATLGTLDSCGVGRAFLIQNLGLLECGCHRGKIPNPTSLNRSQSESGPERWPSQ